MRFPFHIISPVLLSLGCKTLRAEVDFVHQIVPILKEHCIDCHGGDKAKGGFSLNTKELFLEDDAATPGDATASYFLELVEETDPEVQMPPEKKPRVPAAHLALLKEWVNEGMKWEAGFTFGLPTYEPPLRPRMPELPAITDHRENPVDRFIDHYLTMEKLPRPAGIDDATFLRRISLDLIGLLPTPEETLSFLENTDSGKRSTLIAELLGRDLSYADHWLTFWNDLLRNDYSGTGFITGGRTQISAWLYESLKSNKPFDQITRELISPPNSSSGGFIRGIEWRGTVSVAQSLPIQFAQSISQSFLGINMKCASCHDSFIDRWKLADAYGLAAIYSDAPLALHRCDKATGEVAHAAWLFPEIGEIDPAADKATRLSQLADLMIHPENGRTTRTIVNRLWGQLMGRGIVHPLDAMQTEPWLPDLLDFLASDFQKNGYDLKHTVSLIANSQAYQSRTQQLKEEDTGIHYTYGGPRAKRLTAEQFTDLLWSLTGTAPQKFDAPVVRGLSDASTSSKFAQKSTWIWGPSAAAGAPPGGERILLRRDFKPKETVKSAGLLISVDNRFTLYLNGKQLLTGENWAQPQTVIAPIIAGINRLLLVAENGLDTPNPAGAYAALRLVYEDGSDEIISTDDQWQVSMKVPESPNAAKWPIEKLPWEKATPVSLPAWSHAVDPLTGTLLADISANSDLMIRASLLQSDFLMRSLGRPNRDQIVTSRPNELSTLEAIDLANNSTLAENLQHGAETLAVKAREDSAVFVRDLFLSTLTRLPDKAEQDLLTQTLGDNPTAADLADLLWSIFMTPEFLFVR
jgi:hypothetical protein